MTAADPGEMNAAEVIRKIDAGDYPREFVMSVAQGFLPVPGQASLFVEVSPGMDIMRLTDVALKATDVRPGMMIIERVYGMLELHADSQADVRQAGQAILESMNLKEEDRIKPEITSSQVIRNISDYHTQLINRTRHGDMIMQGQTLYTLEVHPAAYAAIAANEAEKAAPIHLLEVITFGAVGRLWLGGYEAEIQEAAKAVHAVLDGIQGRDNKG